jgi:translation initiation factor 2 subunit 1
MISKKQGFPEEGDLVLCTVTSVQFHSVFVDIDEYGRGGMIHISEVSPGRIRNIRDFVREGKKIVCKVLRINQEKGYIDLSLRRVNESEKRRKIDAIKREQNAEKIIETAASKSGLKTVELYQEIIDKMSGQYQSMYAFFEAVSKDGKLLENIVGTDKKYTKALKEIIIQRIKPSEVEIKGKLRITTYAINGIDVVRESLKKAKDAGKEKIRINYLGSGLYKFMVKAPDYKEAEKILKNATESAISVVAKSDGTAEFTRDEKG